MSDFSVKNFSAHRASLICFKCSFEPFELVFLERSKAIYFCIIARSEPVSEQLEFLLCLSDLTGRDHGPEFQVQLLCKEFMRDM